ncbi:ferritin-like metal-binding protein YciE [Ewingella americana]
MTETKAVENYVDWVRDAHAMEEQAEAMLSRMAERLEHYPELKSRILQHIEETKEQQQLVKTVLGPVGYLPLRPQGCGREDLCHGSGYGWHVCQ